MPCFRIILFAVGLAAALPGLRLIGANPPLTEFPASYTYQGQAGGLYGANQNSPSPALAARGLAAAVAVVPLDPSGAPAADGRIGLLVIGMSNTSLKTAAWRALLADGAHPVHPALTLVNGAIGGMDAAAWADPSQRLRQDVPSPWVQLATRLSAAGITPAQVQVIWLHQALGRPARYGPYPFPFEALASSLTTITHLATERFPHLRLIFLSSRAYAGYATAELNPEPHAFESALAVRRVVLADDAPAPDPARASRPALLWGPYLWADGNIPRADGLLWSTGDFTLRDGTHPSPAGAAKAARVIDDFFRHSAFSRDWYLPLPPGP